MDNDRSNGSPRRKKSKRLHDLEFQSLVLRFMIGMSGSGQVSPLIYNKMCDLANECYFMIEEEISEMCYSNCPYEYWSGECKLSGRPYPRNAHCVDQYESDEEDFDEDDIFCRPTYSPISAA